MFYLGFITWISEIFAYLNILDIDQRSRNKSQMYVRLSKIQLSVCLSIGRSVSEARGRVFVRF